MSVHHAVHAAAAAAGLMPGTSATACNLLCLVRFMGVSVHAHAHVHVHVRVRALLVRCARGHGGTCRRL